jgi:hypothetical protein
MYVPMGEHHMIALRLNLFRYFFRKGCGTVLSPRASDAMVSELFPSSMYPGRRNISKGIAYREIVMSGKTETHSP